MITNEPQEEKEKATLQGKDNNIQHMPMNVCTCVTPHKVYVCMSWWVWMVPTKLAQWVPQLIEVTVAYES